MAELADAPDLGLSFQQFSSVSLRTAVKPKTRTNKGSAAKTQEFRRLGQTPLEVAQIVAHGSKRPQRLRFDPPKIGTLGHLFWNILKFDRVAKVKSCLRMKELEACKGTFCSIYR
jgi:hypothetical protein